MPKLRNETDNLIKIGIEEHVKTIMKHFFPEEWKNGLKNVRRPRSEFFAISRDFFDELTIRGRGKRIWSVSDPTVIALIEAQRYNRKWQRVDLGNFYEDQPHDIANIVQQIHRTTYVLSSYWLKTWFQTQPTEYQNCFSQEQIPALSKAFDIERRSLESVLSWL